LWAYVSHNLSLKITIREKNQSDFRHGLNFKMWEQKNIFLSDHFKLGLVFVWSSAKATQINIILPLQKLWKHEIITISYTRTISSMDWIIHYMMCIAQSRV
jgi:hypothetical protein